MTVNTNKNTATTLSNCYEIPSNVLPFKIQNPSLRFELIQYTDDLNHTERKLHKFFKCSQFGHRCFYTTNSPTQFQKHINGHNDASFSCVYCNWKLNGVDTKRFNKENLKNHLIRNHLNRRYQCNFCLFRAYSPDHICFHHIIHHIKQANEKPKSFKKSPNQIKCKIIKCKNMVEKDETTNFYNFYKQFKVTPVNLNTNYYQCLYCQYVNEDVRKTFSHAAEQHPDYPIAVYKPTEDDSQDNSITSTSFGIEESNCNNTMSNQTGDFESPTNYITSSQFEIQNLDSEFAQKLSKVVESDKSESKDKEIMSKQARFGILSKYIKKKTNLESESNNKEQQQNHLSNASTSTNRSSINESEVVSKSVKLIMDKMDTYFAEHLSVDPSSYVNQPKKPVEKVDDKLSNPNEKIDKLNQITSNGEKRTNMSNRESTLSTSKATFPLPSVIPNQRYKRYMKNNINDKNVLICILCNAENALILGQQKFKFHLNHFHNKAQHNSMCNENNCEFIGSQSEIKAHFKQKHKNKVPKWRKFILTQNEAEEYYIQEEEEQQKKEEKRKREETERKERERQIQLEIERKKQEKERIEQLRYGSESEESDNNNADDESGQSEDDDDNIVVPDGHIDPYDPKHNYYKRKKPSHFGKSKKIKHNFRTSQKSNEGKKRKRKQSHDNDIEVIPAIYEKLKQKELKGLIKETPLKKKRNAQKVATAAKRRTSHPNSDAEYITASSHCNSSDEYSSAVNSPEAKTKEKKKTKIKIEDSDTETGVKEKTEVRLTCFFCDFALSNKEKDKLKIHQRSHFEKLRNGFETIRISTWISHYLDRVYQMTDFQNDNEANQNGFQYECFLCEKIAKENMKKARKFSEFWMCKVHIWKHSNWKPNQCVSLQCKNFHFSNCFLQLTQHLRDNHYDEINDKFEFKYMKIRDENELGQQEKKYIMSKYQNHGINHKIENFINEMFNYQQIRYLKFQNNCSKEVKIVLNRLNSQVNYDDENAVRNYVKQLIDAGRVKQEIQDEVQVVINEDIQNAQDAQNNIYDNSVPGPSSKSDLDDKQVVNDNPKVSDNPEADDKSKNDKPKVNDSTEVNIKLKINDNPIVAVSSDKFIPSLTPEWSYGCCNCYSKFRNRESFEKHHKEQHPNKRKLMCRPKIK